MNQVLASPRVSRDIDLFHDTEEALERSWAGDRARLEAEGFEVRVEIERPYRIEAEIVRGSDVVRMEWARDSAFRFFPLVLHEELGLTLHPFDLATNKVLALVGRLEVRDWVDVIERDARLQPLGYLAWAACGKDPAFGPASILEGAARSGRYSRAEVATLAFDGAPPDAAELGVRWRRILDEARLVVEALPVDRAGACVLGASEALFRGSRSELDRALAAGSLRFHEGRIGGAIPRIV